MPRNLSIGSDFGLKFRQQRVSSISQSGTAGTILNPESTIPNYIFPILSIITTCLPRWSSGHRQVREEDKTRAGVTATGAIATAIRVIAPAIRVIATAIRAIAPAIRVIAPAIRVIGQGSKSPLGDITVVIYGVM